MEEDKDKSLQVTEEKKSTPATENYNASETIDTTVNQKLNEKIDEKKEEVKEFFHVRTRTKIIIPISILVCLMCVVLIYAAMYAGLEVQIWQGAIWGLCVILSVYSIFKRSIAASILNIILFLGISLIPAWQMGYEYFRPVIERLTGTL